MSDPYADEIGYAFSILAGAHADKLGTQCESPIERGLLMGFIAIHFIDRTFQIDGWQRSAAENEARVFIQHPIGNYRADFAIHVTSSADKSRSAWIAVECDGHDFHERTKEQAARDKARDRAFTQAGYRVLRFTGSEIYKSNFACATEVWQLVCKILDEWDE